MEASTHFKPFTFSEVHQISGCDAKFLDLLVHPHNGCLQVQYGDDGTFGLDFLQAFEVFVAWRYITEGGGMERAMWAIQTIANLGLDGLDRNYKEGNSFIVSEGVGRYMMVRPPKNRVEKAIMCTKALMYEFKNKLNDLFP